MPGNPSVLFVCTGNLCRSPMAKVLFQRLLEIKLPDQARLWRVDSAGTWTLDGKPASSGAQITTAQLGLSLDEHKSKQVTPEMMGDFNLVLVMEKGHKEALQIEFPDRADRVFLLSEMVGAKFEIDDPLGGEPSGYMATALQIEDLLDLGWKKISDLARVS